MADEPQTDNPLQGYYDWQVTTIMLARDLAEPLQPGNDKAHQQRRQAVEDEVKAFSLEIIPQRFLDDPSLPWPPDLMMRITRETLRRAAAEAGIV